MQCNTVYFLISSDTKNQNESIRYQNHRDMLSKLKAYGFSVTTGHGTYNGQSESSFLVVGQFSDTNLLLNLGREYNQECIMRVYSDNAAELVDCNTKEVTSVGFLRRVDTIDQSKDYSTFNGVNFQLKDK